MDGTRVVDQIAMLNFVHSDSIGRMMASDCFNVSVDMLPSPALNGDSSSGLGFLKEVVMFFKGLKDAYFHISFHPYSLGWQGLPV